MLLCDYDIKHGTFQNNIKLLRAASQRPKFIKERKKTELPASVVCALEHTVMSYFYNYRD
jgi:hypothetical protein